MYHRLDLQQTIDRLQLLIEAGTPVIYLVTHEEARALDYVAKVVRVLKGRGATKSLYRYEEGYGLRELTNLAPEPPSAKTDWLTLPGMPPKANWKDTRFEAHEALLNIRKAKDAHLGNSVTVFFDIHNHLRADNPVLVRDLRNTANALRDSYDEARRSAADPRLATFPYKTVVVVAPVAFGLSPELDRDVDVLEFPLPQHDELCRVLREFCTPRPVGGKEVATLRFPAGTTDDARQRLTERIAGAGRGLTLEEFKLGLNDFAVRNSQLGEADIEDMLTRKAKAITDEALHYTPHVEVRLGGMRVIKDWVRVRRDLVLYPSVREKYRLPAPKGVLLCGASGGGKSMLAKLIAKELDLALLRLDVGALFGSYIGESEQRTRRALQVAEMLAPVVLWVDEIEKAFSGLTGGGDNGVSARVFGYFLTWLAEKQDDVFVVATANNLDTILGDYPEFGRKGRFDEIFWVPLPNEVGRREIFGIYLQPHLNDDFMRVTRADVDAVAAEEGVNPDADPDPPRPGEAAGVAGRLARVLAADLLSENMTGAEIEAAVAASRLKAYELCTADPDAPREVKDMPGAELCRIIVRTLKEARSRALYAMGTPGWVSLNNLETTATNNGWPRVDD